MVDIVGPGSLIRKILNVAYLYVEYQVIQKYNDQYMTYFQAKQQQMAAELAAKGTYLYIYLTRLQDPQWIGGLFAYLLTVLGLVVTTNVVNRKFDIAWIAKWAAWLGYPILYYAIPPGVKAWDYLWWALGLSKGPGPTRPLPPVEMSPDIEQVLIAIVGLGCLLPFLAMFAIGLLIAFMWRITRPDQWKGFSFLNALLAFLQVPLMFYIGEMLAGVYNHPDMAMMGIIASGIIFADFWAYVPSADEPSDEASLRLKRRLGELRIVVALLWIVFDLLLLGLLAAPLIAQNFKIFS